jgi:hypothetical protein
MRSTETSLSYSLLAWPSVNQDTPWIKSPRNHRSRCLCRRSVIGRGGKQIIDVTVCPLVNFFHWLIYRSISMNMFDVSNTIPVTVCEFVAHFVGIDGVADRHLCWEVVAVASRLRLKRDAGVLAIAKRQHDPTETRLLDDSRWYLFVPIELIVLKADDRLFQFIECKAEIFANIFVRRVEWFASGIVSCKVGV